MTDFERMTRKFSTGKCFPGLVQGTEGWFRFVRAASENRPADRIVADVNDGIDEMTWILELGGTRPESTCLLDLVSDYLRGEGFTVLDFALLKTGKWGLVVHGLHADLFGRILPVGAKLVRGLSASVIVYAADEDDQAETRAALKSFSRYLPALCRELTAHSELVG